MKIQSSNDVRYSVVIVSFNPDERLIESVYALKKTNPLLNIYVIDNTIGYNKIIDTLQNIVTVIKNGKNLGIARAQNIGMKLSMQEGCRWVLTLDQDTIVSPNLLNKYIDYITHTDCQKIAIISTDYMDVSFSRPKFGNEKPIDVVETISSGSFINVNIYKIVGGFLDVFFIDQVDNEYCYRIRKKGYMIKILPKVDMEHRLGNIMLKKLFWKKICLYNQSPIRTYYRTRNMILFVMKYKDCRLAFSKIKDLLKDILRILFENDSFKKIKMFIYGFIDGIRMHIKEL